MANEKKVPKKWVLREERGEAILFDPDSLETAWMNETAIRVWKALDRGMNVREIAAHLESVYDIDPRTLESDVRELVESFSHFGMLPKTARRSPESS